MRRLETTKNITVIRERATYEFEEEDKFETEVISARAYNRWVDSINSSNKAFGKQFKTDENDTVIELTTFAPDGTWKTIDSYTIKNDRMGVI